MAVEDIAVTRTIPGLSVFSPVDNVQLAATLMMLVSAFSTCENVRAAYRHAIESGYRMLSFGDAMLFV